MDWFTLALISAVLSAAASILEKKSLFTYDALEFSFILSAFNLLFSLPFFFYVDYSALTASALLVLFVKSVMGVLAFWCVMLALKNLEISGALPLMVLTPGLVAFLAFLFLGESLSPWKVGGMALMVWGSTFLNPGVSLGASLRALAANRPCRTMMVASLFIAAGRVVDARVVGLLAEHPPTVPYALVQAAFSGLYALAFLAVRRRTSLPWRLLRSRPRACLVAGACNIYAYLLLLLALRGLEVSLAEPLSMLGILLSVVLAHFVFHEPLKGRLLGSCLMLLGAWGLFL